MKAMKGLLWATPASSSPIFARDSHSMRHAAGSTGCRRACQGLRERSRPRQHLAAVAPAICHPETQASPVFCLALSLHHISVVDPWLVRRAFSRRQWPLGSILAGNSNVGPKQTSSSLQDQFQGPSSLPLGWDV
ncbi:uncharacterized protein BO66DRAFT_14872 [Aspergillus aculeatinus CBS 121060]|uniref:Uncharacterized protein n=1 Tax=Aspergillus aculeatinus CBS 121060 TaxID=1448322 RepID=A0ACD1HQ31_9EURO|nr:hypothetical protein BO66DRAFT_14872 [Aspergillus aculeatinus CBS 121060]RAH75720.1 hypothetical protein BO66DRAFT_14872 [Aspergillus aculeatinus CBS 121060]